MEAKAGTTFSQRLVQAMGALNANQLASRLSTSASRVKAWLDSDNLPGGEHLQKLPAILRVDGHGLVVFVWMLRRFFQRTKDVNGFYDTLPVSYAGDAGLRAVPSGGTNPRVSAAAVMGVRG